MITLIALSTLLLVGYTLSLAIKGISNFLAPKDGALKNAVAEQAAATR